jgi:putative DNA primase/helicase
MEFETNYTPDEHGKEQILYHIKHLCCHEKDVYEYVFKWIAHMIQRPEEKSNAHIILYGEEGTGKTKVVEMLEIMLGKKKVLPSSNPSRDVWGQFNSPMQNALVVNLNEISKKDTLQADGQIKALVTENTIMINKKGIDAYCVPSYHRFLSTTNNEDTFRTHPKDRRNLMIECHDVLDAAYFERLQGFMNDINVMKTVYEYFKALPDVDKFITMKKPTTQYQNNMRQLSKSPILLWLENFCLNPRPGDNNTRKTEFTNEQLYSEFKHYLEENGFKYECNSNQFSVRLAQMKVKGIGVSRTKDSRFKKFNFDEILFHLGGGST